MFLLGQDEPERGRAHPRRVAVGRSEADRREPQEGDAAEPPGPGRLALPRRQDQRGKRLADEKELNQMTPCYRVTHLDGKNFQLTEIGGVTAASGLLFKLHTAQPR